MTEAGDEDEEHFYHIGGTDQAFVTTKVIELLSEKLCHFVFSIVGILIEGNELHDLYGHAWHCTDSKGQERIVFNFTCHLNFRVIIDGHSYYGVSELKNIKSMGDDLQLSVDHWIHGKAPPPGMVLNQCIAALTSCKMKTYLYKIIIPFRQDLIRRFILHDDLT